MFVRSYLKTFFSLPRLCFSTGTLCDGLSRKLKHFTRFVVSLPAFLYNQKSDDDRWTNRTPKSLIDIHMDDTSNYQAANPFP